MENKKKELFDANNLSSSSLASGDDSSTSSSSTTDPTRSDARKARRRKDDANDNDELRLTVNKKFATNYQSRKEKEELQQIRQRKQRDIASSSDSDSSDEEEDEDGALFTPSINVQFLKTIKALRKRDASIYDPNAQFFDDQIEKNSSGDETKTKTRIPKRYKDVIREQILEQIEDEESEANMKTRHLENSTKHKSQSKFGYDEEQDKLREAFLMESSIADGSENQDDWLVVKKRPPLQDEAKLEQEATKELREIEILSKVTKKDGTFKDPRGEVGDGGQFLLDFFTNKKWVDRNDFNPADDDDADESSLEGIERADEYELNYNFRFEKAAEETATSGAHLSVQTYARSQTMNTVRRQDTTRKDKRQARKERKIAERKAKEEQLKRLKNAKKKEINNKLSQVKAVIGSMEESALDETAILKMLEGDYDPENFEKAMQQAYGEDFYEEEDKEWKTDLDVRRTLRDDNEGDELVGMDDENGGMYDNVQEGEVNDDRNEEDYDEAEEWNDDVYHDSRKESKLEKKMKTKMQEELYKLDYEDIVAGMPTRFKYREVESNDYGLTTQEILFARDTTLKQFVSLKKMAPYNEYGEYNVGSKKRRKFREMLKKDLEDSITVENEKDETGMESDPVDSEPKKKRRRLKKGRKKLKADLNSSELKSEQGNKARITNMKTKLSLDERRNDEKKKQRKKNGKKVKNSNAETTYTAGFNNNEHSKIIKIEEKVVESNKSDTGSKNCRMNADDGKRKKKKKKSKEKKSLITGISHSRLASYGL